VAVTLIAVADYFTGEDIQRGKKSRRPVSLIIVGHCAAATFLQRQPGLGALQSLNLALLVHTEHDRLVGGIQIKPDHVGEFLEESRIA